MEYEQAAGSQDPVHLAKYRGRLFEMLNDHVGGDQIEGLVPQRDLGEISVDLPMETLVLSKSTKIEVYADHQPAPAHEALLISHHPICKYLVSAAQVEPGKLPVR